MLANPEKIALDNLMLIRKEDQIVPEMYISWKECIVISINLLPIHVRHIINLYEESEPGAKRWHLGGQGNRIPFSTSCVGAKPPRRLAVVDL